MNAIDQIRHLQANRPRPSQAVALGLASGRVIQIYDLSEIATNVHGVIGILYPDGFELLDPEAVVSISVGLHPAEEERLNQTAAKLKERYQARL
jgi:hypothetical protein